MRTKPHGPNFASKRPAVTEEAMRAELLALHRRNLMGGAVSILPGPMRDKLKDRGWIECRRPVRGACHGKKNWYVTDAGRAELVDVPGSGIVRSVPL